MESTAWRDFAAMHGCLGWINRPAFLFPGGAHREAFQGVADVRGDDALNQNELPEAPTLT